MVDINWKPDHVRYPSWTHNGEDLFETNGGFNLQSLLLNVWSGASEENWYLNLWDILAGRIEEQDESTEQIQHKVQQIQDQMKYDASQKQAFLTTLEHAHRGLSLIHGPPGAGKTQVLQGIARATAIMGFKTLVCAGSNTAANNMLKKMVDRLLPEERDTIRIVRVHTPSYEHIKATELEDDELVALEQHSRSTDAGVSSAYDQYMLWYQVHQLALARQQDDPKARTYLVLQKQMAKEVKNQKQGLGKEQRKLYNAAYSHLVQLVMADANVIICTLNNARTEIVAEFFFPEILLINEVG